MPPVAAHAARHDRDRHPGGQFAPSRDDRDGDGMRDARDCAPDDPSRPTRGGADLDCDGTPDGGGAGIGVDVVPVDDEPAEQQAASRPSTGTASTKAAARDAAGEAVVAVTGLELGPSIAVYAPARPRAGEPTLVFAAKGNTGLTVTPALVGETTRTLRTRTRSLPQGRAYVVRLRLTAAQLRSTRRVRFDIAVVDTEGDEYRATRAVAVS